MDLQAIKTQVAREVKQLNKVLRALNGIGGTKVGASTRVVKRVLSDEARQRIGDAQRARWARAKKSAGRLKKAA